MAKKITFESKMLEIEALLHEMQKDDTGIEEAVVLYEKVMALIAECEITLQNAQLKVEEITLVKGTTGGSND